VRQPACLSLRCKPGRVVLCHGFALRRLTERSRATIRRTAIGAILTVIAALPGLSVAAAGSYPSRPITVIVPFAPGGATDLLPRLFAEAMHGELGQPVVIENIGGAGGTIGLARAAHAAPDGYTLVCGNWTTFVSNGAVYTTSYDVVKDFEPVILLPGNPHVIAAKETLPPNNLAELVAWLKANQDKVAMATAGVGTGGHFGAVLLQNLTHTEFPLVHYRGGGPALQDMLAGHVDLMTNQVAVFLPHMREGTLKVYAVLAENRLLQAPELPTADEAGLPGFHVSNWNGLWAPKGTPRDAVKKINAAVANIMADPGTTGKLEDLSYEIPPREQLTPEALARLQTTEINKWWPIIRSAGITAN
jgi:tripartite-type tricarboxylate transporter receptor subunit TctC